LNTDYLYIIVHYIYKSGLLQLSTDEYKSKVYLT